MLQWRYVQVGRKIPIRKESNRSWQAGNDPTILQSYEMEQPDATATEYVRSGTKRKHATHGAGSTQLTGWLGRVPLDLISYHLGIDRHTLRSVRDGKPARREVLAKLMELKKLWINADMTGRLQGARDAVRRSRRDYEQGGVLRDLMLRQPTANTDE